MSDQFVVAPGTEVDLRAVDPGDTGQYQQKEQAKAEMKAGRKELARLQELLYAEARHAVLVVLQALDTGGKDGTIRHVMKGVNPQGVRVTSFKVPTPEELAHDYLWRIHKAVPAKGMIGIFNRSHYEDVLVVRVHELAPKPAWSQRFDQINGFEKYLTENGVTLLKFYLHISKQEQKKRLEARLEDPEKQWKFQVGDLKERDRWDDYICAYQEALTRTSTPWAPWRIIPANHKWYRNLCVAQILVDTLRGLDMHWPAPAESLEGIKIPD